MEAKKCIHCGSYQSFGGRINFSATILSLLVALIAVIGAAVPTIKNLLTPGSRYTSGFPNRHLSQEPFQ